MVSDALAIIEYKCQSFGSKRSIKNIIQGHFKSQDD